MKIFSSFLSHVIGILLTIFIASCNPNNYEIDVSDIELHIQIQRLESEMFVVDSAHFDIKELQNNYGDFLEVISTQVLNIGSLSSSNYTKRLYGFTSHPDWQVVFKSVMQEYPNLDGLEDEIALAFKHYKYYFPHAQVPKFYTYISGFNYGVITYEDMIGIGLDMYLGRECQFYNRAQIYNYKQLNMHRDRIVIDCVNAWATAQYPVNDSINNLLSHIIYKGQVMYFVYSMLPQVHDTLKLGYTKAQYDWAMQNQKNIWAHFVDDNRLFTTNRIEIAKYINDAPFTGPFYKQSAPRTGEFIGFKIVESFMKHNPNYTLQQLMEARDYQEILTLSKYNP